jgi:hypothetical protein
MQQLNEAKWEALQPLMLPESENQSMIKALNMYKVISHPSELQYGAYVRWISLTTPSRLVLHRGAIFCDLVVNKNEEAVCVCRNLRGGFFRIVMESCVWFQKMGTDELMLVHAMDMIGEEL